MAFKTQPIGETVTAGVDWSEISKRVAEEIGADQYRLTFLYGSSRPTNALNPLALQRVLFAFEKLGTGGALPVLSFFGTDQTWTDVAKVVIRALGYEPSDEWGSVLDENDNPIRVISHSGSKLCFAVNVYGPTLSDLEARAADGSSDSGDAGAGEAVAGGGDSSDGGDMELDFDES